MKIIVCLCLVACAFFSYENFSLKQENARIKIELSLAQTQISNFENLINSKIAPLNSVNPPDQPGKNNWMWENYRNPLNKK